MPRALFRLGVVNGRRVNSDCTFQDSISYPAIRGGYLRLAYEFCLVTVQGFVRHSSSEKEAGKQVRSLGLPTRRQAVCNKRRMMTAWEEGIRPRYLIP